MRQRIAECLRCHPSKINEQADLRQLGATPDRLALLFASLSGRFLIAITPEEMAFCQSVGTVTDLIENKLELRSLCSGRRSIAR